MEIIKFYLPSVKPFAIAPLGDIQWNGDPHEIDCGGLERHIARCLEENAYFLGMGDYIDFASPSSRQRLLSSGAYDGPMKKLDDVADHLVREVYTRFLKPTTGRWIGMLEGHHFWGYRSGETSDMKLCRLLKTVHLGTEAGIEVCYAKEGSLKLWAHHGFGAGSEGALLNKLKLQAADWEGVRVFLMGHMTKLASTVIPKLTFVNAPSGPVLTEVRVILAGTGGWSKGKILARRDGVVPRGNYVEQAGMRPVSLGAPIIRCTGWRTHGGPPMSHDTHRTRVLNPQLEILNQ